MAFKDQFITRRTVTLLLSVLGLLLITTIMRMMTVSSAPTTLFRVNAGGPQVTGTPNWAADTKNQPSPYSNASSTGNLAGSTTAAINMTHASMVNSGVPASTFKTYRMDAASTAAPLTYTFPVSPGEYEVRLYFAETNSANFKVGARTFDIHIEDGLMENTLDVYQSAGAGNKAIKRTYRTTTLDNGLKIEFINKVKNPFVSAIEIVQVDLPGTWKGLMPTETARDEASFEEVNGKFYLAGGNINLTTVADQQEYDPITNSWRTVAPLPEPLNHIQSVVHNGLIYYIGGLKVWPGPHSNKVYIYNPVTDTFSEGAPMPRGRGAGGTVVYNNKIYYAGGLSDGAAVNWFDEYDPAANTWRQLPSMPTKKDHFHAGVVGDKLYAIAGRNLGAGALINENIAFDFTQNKWLTGLAPAPTPRGGFATTVVGDEVIVLGGERRMPNLALNSVEAYNTTTNTWRVLAPMPLPNHGIAAAECNGGIYVANGSKIGGDKGTHNTVNALFLGDETTLCLAGDPVVPPLPTVTLSADPTSILKGQTTKVTWSSTDASVCMPSGNASGWVARSPKAPSGSQTLKPGRTITISLTCSGAGGSSTQTISVPVT
jgi:large repetitive protein